MTIQLLSPIEDKEEKVKEPSKAWVNRYRALRGSTIMGAPHVRIKRGQVYDSPFVWPSLDVAETKHHERAAESKRRFGAVFCKWLGAFPITE